MIYNEYIHICVALLGCEAAVEHLDLVQEGVSLVDHVLSHDLTPTTKQKIVYN